MKIGDRVRYKPTGHTGVIVSNYINDRGNALWDHVASFAYDFIIETTDIPGRWSPNPNGCESHGLREDKQYFAVKEWQIVVVEEEEEKVSDLLAYAMEKDLLAYAMANYPPGTKFKSLEKGSSGEIFTVDGGSSLYTTKAYKVHSYVIVRTTTNYSQYLYSTLLDSKWAEKIEEKITAVNHIDVDPAFLPPVNPFTVYEKVETKSSLDSYIQQPLIIATNKQLKTLKIV